MNKFRLIAALAAVAFALSVNLAPLSSGSVAQLQTAQADTTGSVDASAAWNSVCAQWEFPDASFSGTFAQAWASVPNHQRTYQQSIIGITAMVNGIVMGSEVPPNNDDTCGVVIHNWAVN